jgi:hypothetical protein
MSLELFSGKDVRARELTIFINFSRDPHLFQYPTPEIVVQESLETQFLGELLEKMKFLGVDY